MPYEVSSKQERLGQIQEAEHKLIAELLSLQSSSASKSDWKRKASDVMNSHSLFLYNSFKNYKLSSVEVQTKQMQQKWTFSHAVLFAVTLLTTIGYGNPVPTTFTGKLVCFFCALFGIPIALVTVANLGKFLGIFLILIYRRISKTYNDMKDLFRAPHKAFIQATDSHEAANGDNQSLLPAAVIIAYLLLYICFAAMVFYQLETWSLFECLYFSFVTTTTVGFGDLVPTSTGTTLFIVLLIIFFGSVITSMCIDLVGVSYLRKIHYLGRKIVALGDGLAIVGGRVVYVGDMCSRFHSVTMSLRKPRVPSRKDTFIPDEISMIEYIDHDAESVKMKNHHRHCRLCPLGCKFHKVDSHSSESIEKNIAFGQTILV